MMEKQYPVYMWVLCILLCLPSIIFVFCYVLKNLKRRAKYNATLPGMKIAWYDFLAGVKYLNLSQKARKVCSLQTSVLQAFSGHAQLYQHEKLVCHWLTCHPFVIPLKGESAKEMLMNTSMQDKNFMYKQLVAVVGTGLITSSGDKWKCRRRMLNQCFHSEVLNDFIPIFNAQACKLVRNLQKGCDHEIRLLYDSIFHCLLDIVCETNLGINTEAEGIETKNLFDTFESIKAIFMERAANWWMWPGVIFRFTKTCRTYNYYKKNADNFTNSVLQQKKKEYESRETSRNVGKRKSVLELLLEYHMEHDSISEEGIKEELKTFTAAATDTTSTTLLYALYFIGQYKDIQAIAREEVDRIFRDDKTRPVEKEDLNEMRYIDCILKETMRLYPPVPIFCRAVLKDTDICGYSIPEGASSGICPYILHRDPEVFPNPENFDPTRFAPQNSAKRHPFAYIPFSAGPRNCIGQKYAMMVMKTIVSTILRHFSLESLDQRDKLNLGIDITLTPSIPLRFRLKKRT